MNLFSHKHLKTTLALCVLSYLPNLAQAFSEPCQLVAQMVGSKTYQVMPLRLASMASPAQINRDWQLQPVENHGAWYIYQTPTPWMTKEQCAPLTKNVGANVIEFVPVLMNKTSGHHAVISGNFIIKVYQYRDLAKVIKQYNFLQLSPLPNPQSVIVDVKPQSSYDRLIETLDKDRDVDLALPILIEP
ncbi:hypothetical protein [Thiomicrorhabdus sediminis]|uniref:Sporulation related domain-containing protein n=1 Tax=Thiomicrorhabdus sediminis TaxID=2580412 RepID=A0A4P9K5I7_9GAMM|nr:hypothetical protein [Thiomicrorhabdus sediminis]QCU89516.1 hypothetical protein FE785_02130 [Thiomicrorhabdus sediminis]